MDGKSKQLCLAPDEELQGLIRLHRGPSTSPQGWLTLSGPQSWTPAPGPCQALRSCVCLKTRLNPPQQLSQIRSQFSAKGCEGGAQRAAGADCRTDVEITESIETLKVKKSGVECPKLAQMTL